MAPPIGGRPVRCTVVGIVNVTPDSFSDGGLYLDPDLAVRHGLRLREQGADLVDVGGESTRPGAERVSADVEAARVIPVVRGLVEQGVPVSVDTTRASVARRGIEVGATVVNDVSGGLADPDMARVVADARVRWILMHWRGHSRDMHRHSVYADVVAEVRDDLSRRVDAALAVGCREEQLIVDPGLGFSKLPEHNWELLRGLDALVSGGLPVLVGASRKSFLGALLAGPDGAPRPPEERDSATLATSVLAAAAGAWGVRVHDVASTVDALKVVAAVRGLDIAAVRDGAGIAAVRGGTDGKAPA